MNQPANGKVTGGRVVPLNLGIKSDIGPAQGTVLPERRMAGHKRMEAIHLLAQGEPHKEIAARLGFTTRQIGRLSAEHKGEVEAVKEHIAAGLCDNSTSKNSSGSRRVFRPLRRAGRWSCHITRP